MSRAADERNVIASNSARRARVASSSLLVVVLVAPGALAWAWSRAVPAPPGEMPPLLLDPRAVAQDLAEDRERAARAPTGELADERRRLYEETNVAEREARDAPGRAQLRREALVAALAALEREHGSAVISALRASDASRLDAALSGELPAGERVAELGEFVETMGVYGAIVANRQTAPRLVLRTLFQARWNALHERELTEGLSPIELVAYWGWLALHAEGAPVERRLEALSHYAAAGGARAEEARAVLLYDAGELDDAREAFESAFAASPIFRLRNHALACTEP